MYWFKFELLLRSPETNRDCGRPTVGRAPTIRSAFFTGCTNITIHYIGFYPNVLQASANFLRVTIHKCIEQDIAVCRSKCPWNIFLLDIGESMLIVDQFLHSLNSGIV